MKYISSQLSLFLSERGVRRNLSYFLRFLLLLITLVTVYSVLFHYIMAWEGRDFSPLTGAYWTLTVMSTLGFGDITFTSDLGKVFSIVVLMSGIICLLVMLPFAFIQLIYMPWLEAQKKKQTPRGVPESIKNHIILVGLGPVTLNLAEALARYGFHCVLLCGDTATTLDLKDQGYHTVMGSYDDGEVYRRLQVRQAAMIVAMDSDVRNTNVVFSAREMAPEARIIARAEKDESLDILELAGCTRVFQFRKLLGQGLARRVTTNLTRASIVTSFGPLVVSEAPVMRTALVGQTLRESDVRRKYGLNVVGIWEHGSFVWPKPDIVLSEKSVLIIAGSQDQMAQFSLNVGADPSARVEPHGPVLVLGGGRVGVAAASDLHARGLPVVVVDKRDRSDKKGDYGWVRGDAADLAVLEEAGIRAAPSVIITTHDDDINIYLTIYCRRLRPDIQIISRATLDHNVSILHSAGADLVLSLVSMMTNTIVNMLSPGKVFMLNEGLNIFRARVGGKLDGKTLGASGIRDATHCSVVMVQSPVEQPPIVNPAPDYRFVLGDTLYLIGDSASESAFYARYGHEALAAKDEEAL